ncbi:hypothetical protein Tco_0009839 [Tanacetum coccineum]
MCYLCDPTHPIRAKRMCIPRTPVRRSKPTPKEFSKTYDLEPDDESVDTPLVYPFLDSDDDFDDGEVLNELVAYGNAGQLCRQRAINGFDEDDLSFQSYNTIMVEGLESTWKNLVAIVRDVYVLVGSFTYITNFVILEDIGEFILRDMAEVVMGNPFRKVTKLEHDYAEGLMSFTRIFDNYTF